MDTHKNAFLTPKGREGDCHIATGRARSVGGQEFSGCCDGGPPCVHRHSPKCAVRLSGSEMTLDVEDVVDGRMG
jgi:hypothetical protein